MNVIRDAYPSGLNAHEVEEKTAVPLKTIYPSLNELDNEGFIYQVSKQHNLQVDLQPKQHKKQEHVLDMQLKT